MNLQLVSICVKFIAFAGKLRPGSNCSLMILKLPLIFICSDEGGN